MRPHRTLALAALALLARAALGAPLILLDPGHGGDDPGVTERGFKESEFSLDLAQRLRAQLQARGLQVKLTREGDQDLSPSARVALADALMPAALISLHANAAFQATAHGPRIFVPAAGPVDEPAAPLWTQASRLKAAASRALGLSLAKALGATSPRTVQSLKLALFRGLLPPACVVECEFASDPAGLAELKDTAKRDVLAARLANGIAAWAHAPEAPHAP